MSIAADFSIDTDNRIVSHTSGATVYPVNDLYSYLQDYFDELTLMTIPVPMSAQTPTEYTLVNGWFIPEEAFKYLRTGAVKTLGWDTTEYADGVMIISFASGGYISAVPADIGQVVTDGGDTGILLDYNNTLRKWWVRKTSATSLSGAVTIPTGTGAGTITTVVSGETLFTNVYTLGALDPLVTSNLYVEQINPELTNNQITQYWSTGHVDIIVKVKEANVLIDNGFVRIYCREYTDLYSHFSIDLSTGGRNPVPLGTSSDSNNQTASGTVATWNDVTVTFGSITRDLLNGSGMRPYDCEIDCGSRTSLSQVYERLKLLTARASGFTLDGYPGQFYRNADPTYGENISSPFGTYAGGDFFAARGVFLKNVPPGDVNSYSLIDSTGATNTPPFFASGVMEFTANLVGPDSTYRLVYAVPPGTNNDYGDTGAITVNDATGAPITGIISSETMSFTYDYDGNTQGGFTAGTNREVVLLGVNPGFGKLTISTNTLNRSNALLFKLDAATDNFYV